MSDVINMPIKPKPEKLRTITLTNRAPVQIKEEEWPIIAEGCSEDSGGPYEYSVKFWLRKGNHCQVIFYGIEDYFEDTDYQRGEMVKVGRHFTEIEMKGGLWKVMREVGEEMRSRIQVKGMDKHVTLALDACFAKLEPLSY